MSSVEVEVEVEVEVDRAVAPSSNLPQEIS